MYSAQVSPPSHPHHQINPINYYDVFNSPITLQDHDGVVLSYLLSQQLDTDSSSKSADVSIKDSSKQGEEVMMEKRKSQISKTRKRSSGKKDRHSKICTAKGPRERRMRLSVQIARKFFDLQDALGFDKASKTIEWLLTKARSAIEELKQHLDLSPTCRTGFNSLLSASSNNESNEVVRRKKKGSGKTSGDENRDAKKIVRGSRVVKRSRDEARERARERTRAKQQSRVRSSDDANPKDLGFSFMDQDAKNSINGEDEHDYIIMGRSIRGDCGFPSFNGNWGSKMEQSSFTGNPRTSIMGLSSKHDEEHSTSYLSPYFSSSNSQQDKYRATNYSKSILLNEFHTQPMQYYI